MARTALPLLLTLAAAVPGAAYGGSPFDKVLQGAGSVELSGPVDVPLYGAPSGGARIGVFVGIGEHRFLLQVLPGTSSIHLDASSAGKVGAKVKAKEIAGAEYQYIDVSEMRLGDATLRDVRVLTTAVEVEAVSAAGQEPPPSGLDFDGHIGLAALTEHIAWTLDRDAGVLQVGPAGSGAAMVAELGGQTLETRNVPSTRVRFGKNRTWTVPEAMIATVNIGGHDVDAHLSWWAHASVLDTSRALPADAPSRTRGDTTRFWVPAGPADHAFPTWVVHSSTFSHLSTEEGRLLSYDGVLGRDILEEFNVSYDPATGDLAYKPAENPTYADPLPELLADAQATLDASMETPEDAAADAVPPEGDKDAWRRIAAIKRGMGDAEGALEALEAVVRMDETTCTSWQQLGTIQWAMGDLDGAQASLQKAADLFNAWWSTDIPLSPTYQALSDREIALENRNHLAALSRAEWSELIARAEKKGVEPAELGVPDGLTPQSGPGCRLATADLASVLFAKGDIDRIDELYASRSDWDSTLPLIAGNAALASANLGKAQSAYRQNAKRDLDRSSHARIGLALVSAKAGRWDDAKRLWAQAIASDRRLHDSAAWLALRSEEVGAVGAAKEAAQLSDADPGWAGGAVLWAEWAKVAGDEARIVDATRRAKSRTADRLRHDRSDAFAIAMNARLALVSGDIIAARKGAERAVKLAPGSVHAHEALALVEAAEGDEARSVQTMRRAASLAPQVPYCALKLGAP
ncbi:MAG: hypothetical protein VX265_02105 [Myxococcota bacterium]|nr:hypothetical protein [Myxococcota bacterium]